MELKKPYSGVNTKYALFRFMLHYPKLERRGGPTTSRWNDKEDKNWYKRWDMKTRIRTCVSFSLCLWVIYGNTRDLWHQNLDSCGSLARDAGSKNLRVSSLSGRLWRNVDSYSSRMPWERLIGRKYTTWFRPKEMWVWGSTAIIQPARRRPRPCRGTIWGILLYVRSECSR